jgi:hypothetical protein
VVRDLLILINKRRGEPPMATATPNTCESEVTILARILTKENGKLPAGLARYILDLELSDRDKHRMHELAVRNQDDGLSTAEKDEMAAFAKATTLVSILKSRARRSLGVTLKPSSDS